ncbi:M13 family metallopeptidase [soil metagenome]
MKSLMIGVAFAALIAPAAAFASDADHPCVASACRMEALFGAPASPGGGYSGIDTPKYGTWGFNMAGRDTTVNPGDDFFDFANGTALKTLEIPADRSRYGSFNLLSELSDNRLKVLITDISANTALAAGSDEAKIRDLYNSYLDEARVEQLGATPIQPMLAEIRAATTREALAAYMGKTVDQPGGSIFGAYIGEDAKDPTKYAVYLGQSGLGLPDRDYYLLPTYADKKAAYQVYVAQMLTLAGWDNPDQAAADIVAMETRIATDHWTKIESRDDDKTYNPMTRAELIAANPGFDWNGYFQAAELGGVQRFIVAQNTAFPKIAAVFADTPIATLQAWQAFHTIDQSAPMLSKAFVDANWTFRSHVMSGALEQRTRDKRAVSFAESNLGEALGRAYVGRWFPAENKAKMEELVANLRRALSIRIDKLDWMTPETKAKAQEKLAKFRVKIGYPNKWRDYSGLEVKPDDLTGNALRAQHFEWMYQVNRLNGPVDKDEWGMTPQTVNAYYNPTGNEIVFPAAILQPPFFDPDADPAVNYGGIGGVIGHEIGHGFDDQGRKSDGDGVLREWWTPADEQAFEAKTTALGAQYDSYEPLAGYHVQGGLTMGENIGDASGIAVGLEAYHLSLNGQAAPIIDGTTGDQRFFYGWAQVWQSKIRDEALKQQVATDPHSPAIFRVIGPLRNSDAWYQAFDIQPGSKYYLAPADRVRIW